MHNDNQDIDKLYISDYDKFLFDFDKSHVKTPAQLAEINKHSRIASLRDANIAVRWRCK